MNKSVSRLSPLLKSAVTKQGPLVLSRNAGGCGVPEDTYTHTGQKWDTEDYRLARFMNSPKQVNPNWAVNLIAAVPPQAVDQSVVWCDGGSGPEGHPRVYINLDKPGEHACGYCGLRFVQTSSH
ncbi:probable NADH dehydrogenase [ubiquinone] iron-sulfur protein 6, mitochondrial [Hyposmocoma kahamanoa]|uniref:probable NADH dehydrogenase [ubiquinone] iron-sulfur protein 6, mitochondrial n=1 Tax=Hyposmocoma kahamanoa TaxID=1477025 RepID=UPI000E6D87D5|nr:probable NADH dehydrogenase [ubiquinone] iron-sulfur protein 6, mitochondrial [Hyposmocoma kahamanoa]